MSTNFWCTHCNHLHPTSLIYKNLHYTIWNLGRTNMVIRGLDSLNIIKAIGIQTRVFVP